VNKIRSEEKNTLVLDSGDLFFQDFRNIEPAYALKKAGLVARAYKKMGVSAINVGDLDLFQRFDFLMTKDAVQGVPLISANVRRASDKTLLFSPYRIQKLSGIRIGVFGLMRQDLPQNVPRDVREKIFIEDPIQAARDTVRELRGKADIILLLSDLGFNQDRELAGLAPGIHFILGGHDKRATSDPHQEGKTFVTQSWVSGMYVGSLRLTLERSGMPFKDKGTPVRLREQIRNLDVSLSSLRMNQSQNPTPRNIEETIKTLSQQKRSLEKDLNNHPGNYYSKGNLLLWQLIPLESSLPVDPEIDAWIRESGVEADEEMTIRYPEEKRDARENRMKPS
jgi:2',3'-cyclic-nucleotide 2'-phosphodiesterase (5'-nucleotidase family)